jgi:hypothetical protein
LTSTAEKKCRVEIAIALAGMAKRNNYKPKLTGGLFITENSKTLDLSKSIPVSLRSEADEQAAFFGILRAAAPRPPLVEKVIQSGKNKGTRRIVENLLDDKFINAPLYVLTRVRHFPNEGKRSGKWAAEQGIRAGAFDVYLDAARRCFSGLRMEFKTLSGTISDDQRAERIWLDRENYFAHYVFHSLEAVCLLAWYLSIDLFRFTGFPRTRYALPRAFDPAAGHDRLCGCQIKIKDLLATRIS